MFVVGEGAAAWRRRREGECGGKRIKERKNKKHTQTERGKKQEFSQETSPPYIPGGTISEIGELTS